MSESKVYADGNVSADLSGVDPAWFRLFPNLSYDVIGRIVPGVMTVLLLLYLLRPQSLGISENVVSISSILLLLSVGYAVGLFFDVLAIAMINPLIRWFNQLDIGPNQEFWTIYYTVLSNDRKPFYMKLWAERLFFSTMSIGVFTCAMVAAFFEGRVAFREYQLFMLAALLMALCVAWDRLCRRHILMFGLQNLRSRPSRARQAADCTNGNIRPTQMPPSGPTPHGSHSP